MVKPVQTNQRGNAYNEHRERIRKDEEYRKRIVKEIGFMKPAMVITEVLNGKLELLVRNQQK